MARRLLVLLVSSGLLLPLACAKGSGAKKPLVGGEGRLVWAGRGGDLRLSPDGAWAAFLKSPMRPGVKGVAPSLGLGDLVVAPLNGQAPRTLGPGVTNAPGGFLFSPDSRWILFLQGYNPVSGAGELRAFDLKAPSGEPVALGRAVSFVVVSPDSRRVAFVDGGVLKLERLGEPSSARELGGEVRVAQFSPDGRSVAFRRTFSAGGALLLAPAGDKADPPVKLGDRAGDFDFSPDGRWLAFMLESPTSRDVYDLHLTRTDRPAPEKVSSGTDLFAFSPDSQWLGRTEGAPAGRQGDLFVGRLSGGAARKVGEKVERFSFSPTSGGVAAFEKHTDHPRLRSLRVTQLPAGQPTVVAAQADTYAWSHDGKHLAFNVEVYRPLPAINLYAYGLGDAKPTKVGEGVYGFAFASRSDLLLYRTECTKGEGGVMPRSCELKALDLSKQGAAPEALLSGIYSFRLSEDNSHILYTMVRSDSDAYDTADYNVQTRKRLTLDERTLLPPLFASPSGARVVYLISSYDRPGLYVAEPGV